MPRLLKPLVVLLLIAAAAAMLLLGPRLISPDEEAAPAAGASARPALPVLAEPVTRLAEQVTLEAVGTSRARQSVLLRPKTDGHVVAVKFRAGEAVEGGELLLELDRRSEALQLELAQVRLAEAERELSRRENLARAKAIASVDLDTARTAARLARLEVEQAEVALAERSVFAPFSGHIGLTDVDPGDWITTETAIAPLDDRASLLVSFEVPEQFLGRLKRGQQVTLTPWVAGTARSRGEIVYLGSQVDPQRRTFLARARVDNAKDRLRPGMSFRVSLALRGRDYPAVPEVSLQWGDRGSFVWTVVDGHARRVPVTIVQRLENRILVDGALEAGTPVITEGVQSAREGLPVKLLSGAAAAEG